MHTEQELDDLIEKKIKESTFPNISDFRRTDAGLRRIRNRVKEYIFNDKVADIDACLIWVENQLGWETDGL